jgi:two-component system, NarL family, invasion response regulator UvrY
VIRVVIADDHTLVRQGMKRILQAEPDLEVVGEAGDSAEAFRCLAGCDADVLVLDISMPGAGGLDVLRQLKSLQPRLRTLVVSMYPEQRFAIPALRLGAAGYLTKDRAPEELVEAIRRIARGARYIGPELAELLAGDLDNERLPHQRLSDREAQIFERIVAGKRVSEIAEELGLTVATVHTYRSRILDKMNARSNADLLRYAADHDLLG